MLTVLFYLFTGQEGKYYQSMLFIHYKQQQQQQQQIQIQGQQQQVLCFV